MKFSLIPDGAVDIPKDKFFTTNKSAAVKGRRTPKEYGGGYLALIDIFHQLHCLVSAFNP